MELSNMTMEEKGHIAVVTINHPPANAWNLAAMEDFKTVLDTVEANKDIRVMVITGAGDRCFSAGFDVTDAANAARISAMGRELWRRLDLFVKPTIAAINGFALGGGLELALCCHFRIMADSPRTTLGLTELNLGIIPAWGGTQRLPRLIGRARALEMILLSRKVGATQAMDMGLVNLICPPDRVMPEAMNLASTLAKRPPIAVRCVLEAMGAGIYHGIDQGLKVEEQGALTVRNSKDRQEGFKAFLEKREPVFTGE